METIFNQFIFNQFKEKFNGKTLNEILGCAKIHCCNLSLIKDVDEYNNNEFAFVVEWCPNDEHKIYERIKVECRYSHLTGNAEFTLINEEVRKFGRTWYIVKDLDLKEQENGFPIPDFCIVGCCPWHCSGDSAHLRMESQKMGEAAKCIV